MITAEIITDEQIRDLREGVLVHEAEAADVYRMCQDALGNFYNARMTAEQIGSRIDYARKRCAQMLSARENPARIGDTVVGELDTGGELRGKVVALVGRLATVRDAAGRTFTRSLVEIYRIEADAPKPVTGVEAFVRDFFGVEVQ